jgi:hypothetical protein
MEGPDIAREKLQRFSQVPDYSCLSPEIRISSWNNDLQLTAPTGAVSSLHNTIRKRDRTSNQHEVVNTWFQWFHTITAEHLGLNNKISADTAADLRPPWWRRGVAHNDAGRRYLT